MRRKIRAKIKGAKKPNNNADPLKKKPTSIRLLPETKRALVNAAIASKQSFGSLIDSILRDWGQKYYEEKGIRPKRDPQ